VNLRTKSCSRNFHILIVKTSYLALFPPGKLLTAPVSFSSKINFKINNLSEQCQHILRHTTIFDIFKDVLDLEEQFQHASWWEQPFVVRNQTIIWSGLSWKERSSQRAWGVDGLMEMRRLIYSDGADVVFLPHFCGNLTVSYPPLGDGAGVFQYFSQIRIF